MPPARKIVWSPQAKSDLKRIWRYYARAGSSEVADRILREIATEAKRIGLVPIPGRERDEFPGLRRLLVHPHTLFFRIRGDEAEVARVLHQQRDFPTILGAEDD